MALVAGLGIIAVAAFILVFIVHITLLMLVAVQAAKGAGVAGGMTLRTIQTVVVARQGKGCMIKGSRCPGRAAVALFTTMRVILRHVGWSRLIVGAVTRIAFRG